MNIKGYNRIFTKSNLYLSILICTVFLYSDLISQPYYYYSKMRDTMVVSDIFRIDFNNGNNELYIEDAGRINQLFWNSDQTNLFLKQRFTVVDVVKLDSSNKYLRISENEESIVNILDAPQINRTIIEFGDIDRIYKHTIIFNRTTFNPIDTLVFDSQGNTFLSQEENILYANIYDKQGIYFSAINILNNTLLYENNRCSSLGPSPYYFGIEDGKKGKALIFYHDGEDEYYEKQNFVVCKPDSDIYFAPINIPFRTKGYLSVDADYVIMEEVDWVEEGTTSEFHTGEIHIYNAATGNKITNLSLPPNGEILFFDNFPNMFYYFNTTTHSVVPVDLTAFTNNDSSLFVKLQDSQDNQLLADSLHYYDNGWQSATDNSNGTFTVQTERSTVSLKMFYLGGIQHKSNVTVGADTVVFQTVNTTVQLKDSQDNFLAGDTVKYYAGGWKHFGIATNGTASKELLARNYTFKMQYLGSSINLIQNTDSSATVVFQTKNTTVQLKDSQDNFLTGDTVKYYVNGWQHFGIATNGTTSKELLPKNYTFKMYYAGTNKNIVQNTDLISTVVFQTVNAEVQLKDSQGNLLDGGTVEYYASGWKDFGVATNGKANKELLSRKYTFKMHYAEAQNNLVQNLDTSTTVVFNTVNTTVQLKDSQGNLLDGGVVQYYAGGWLDFGTVTNGEVTKELLLKNYTFKMKYGGTDKNIVQNLDSSTTVTFQTVNTEVQLRDSQGNLLDGGFAKYYASSWKDFGEATNGIVSKELLSRKYTFKMQYGGANMNHVQNLDTNTTVVFSTISVTAQLKDSQGNLLDGGTATPEKVGQVEYYAAGWKPFGEATNGTAVKELLPKNYSFKVLLGGLNTTKQQDVGTNNTVDFTTTLTTIKVTDNQNQAIENAEVLYFGGGWKQIGNTNVSGEVTTELLARSITFKAKQGTTQKNKQQDTSTNSVVEIILE